MVSLTLLAMVAMVFVIEGVGDGASFWVCI
jgi:hypothetical protein